MKSIQNINLWTKHSYLREFEYNNGVVSSHKSEDGKCNGQAKQDPKKRQSLIHKTINRNLKIYKPQSH